jgi:AcrR family transcriptional regulator
VSAISAVRGSAGEHASVWRSFNGKVLRGRHGLPSSVVAQIQRERLLDAMVAVVAEQGYQDSSVEKVVVRSGVSRRTFYELFANREDCFLAAYDEVVSKALALVDDACRQGSSPDDQIAGALRAFVQFWAEHPAEACTCVDEVMVAGLAGRARQAETVERLARLLERPLAELRGARELDALAARAFIGGIYELLRAPADPGDLTELPERIVAWERRGPTAARAPAPRRAAGRSAG